MNHLYPTLFICNYYLQLLEFVISNIQTETEINLINQIFLHNFDYTQLASKFIYYKVIISRNIDPQIYTILSKFYAKVMFQNTILV